MIASRTELPAADVEEAKNRIRAELAEVAPLDFDPWCSMPDCEGATFALVTDPDTGGRLELCKPCWRRLKRAHEKFNGKPGASGRKPRKPKRKHGRRR